MIVRCINNAKHGLGLEYGFEPINLEISKEYKVYGVEIARGHTIVYISDMGDPFYPSKYSLHHFEIVSKKLSKHWQIELKEGEVKLFVADWFKFPDFLHRYIEGTEENSGNYPFLIFFQEVKTMIDKEQE